MKIDRIELYLVAMPLISPWRTAYGEDASVHSVLCRMSSGSIDAWGEASALAAPCYSPEWGGGVFAVLRDWFAPALIGKNIASGEQLQAELSLFKGNQFAKGALDATWWNLHALHENRPLHELLGATRSEVPVGADFGVLDNISDLLDDVDRAVEEKFPRIKLKFRPGWDVPMLEAVRERQPDHPVHIDCNSGYRISDADFFEQLDRFHLAMTEQPLQHDDLYDHSQLQQRIQTPICLDESIVSVDRARQAIAMGSCRYVNIKPARVGGLTNAVAIHNLCRDAGIPCWVGGMLESAVGSAQCTSLAMLDNFTYAADIFPSSRFYHEDLSDPPLELHRDTNGVPSVKAPLSSPTPVPERLKKLTIASAVIP